MTRLLEGKPRIYLAWIFSILIVLMAKVYPHWSGGLICFLGATLRFWASGYLRKDAKLSIGGAYRFTRNPLYLGTFLMAIGTALSVQLWLIAALIAVCFYYMYDFTIQFEETKLREYFGQPYLEFCNLVPRFFPKMAPASWTQLSALNAEPEAKVFSWEVAMKNKAYEAYASFAGLIGFVYLIVALKKYLGWID